MNATALPLSQILNVTVIVTPTGVPGLTYNQALIVGPSTVIPTTGHRARLRQYGTLDDMLADNFNASMPEYKAAALYFGQYPKPAYVWIGRQDLVAGETPLEAFTACRETDLQWYAGMFVGAATVHDHLAIAEYIEGVTPPSQYWLTWADLTTAGGSPPAPLFEALMAAGYKRTFSVYSTPQTGSTPPWPDNIYASAAVLGVAMGRNNGLPGSYFDIMFKPVRLIGPEPLTIQQTAALCGTVDRTNPGVNANVVVQYQNGDIWTQMGVMASGNWFDQILFLDMLVNQIQVDGVHLLTTMPAVPITDGGALAMKNAIAAACQTSQDLGFIAPSGVWHGPAVPTYGIPAIQDGSALPKGYYLWSQPVSSMTADQRAKRILPSITVALIEAESGHSLTVTVLVQQ
jgi:hypothetical protein